MLGWIVQWKFPPAPTPLAGLEAPGVTVPKSTELSSMTMRCVTVSLFLNITWSPLAVGTGSGTYEALPFVPTIETVTTVGVFPGFVGVEDAESASQTGAYAREMSEGETRRGELGFGDGHGLGAAERAAVLNLFGRDAAPRVALRGRPPQHVEHITVHVHPVAHDAVFAGWRTRADRRERRGRRRRCDGVNRPPGQGGQARSQGPTLAKLEPAEPVDHQAIDKQYGQSVAPQAAMSILQLLTMSSSGRTPLIRVAPWNLVFSRRLQSRGLDRLRFQSAYGSHFTMLWPRSPR